MLTCQTCLRCLKLASTQSLSSSTELLDSGLDACCACRPLRMEGSTVRRGALAYVVAFAGGGAKDITGRYAQLSHCMPCIDALSGSVPHAVLQAMALD